MKSIYKYIFSLSLGLMLFGMQSCSDDKTENESGPRPVILKAEVFTAGNDAGATWSSGQSLGVYMLKNGSNEIIGDNANIKFLADNRGTTGYLVPANNIPIYYPTDGSKVDFRVYYPYNENIATRSLGINQTEVVIKNNTKADALLYSDNCQGATGDNKPTIQIKSMLSVVKLDMRCQLPLLPLFAMQLLVLHSTLSRASLQSVLLKMLLFSLQPQRKSTMAKMFTPCKPLCYRA